MARTPLLLTETPPAEEGEAMDALTCVLSAMKLSGSIFLEAEFTHPWCVESQIAPEHCRPYFREPAHVISYHYIVSGELLCSISPEPPRKVRAGQIMLLPRNEPHLMGSTLTASPTPTRNLIQPAADGRLPRIDWGGGGEKTSILCGFLGTLSPINSFLLSLPSILIVDVVGDASGEWLASSIRYASSESARSPELVGRLAELLFAEAVKRYLGAMPQSERGWLAGLRNPHVSRALTLLHSRPDEPWTTEALAREVGLSRSALAARFTQLIGEPPIRYLARQRMNVAANLLREGEPSCNIAYVVGFNSEAAFNRAFKKEFGMPPGQWRNQVSASASRFRA